MYAKPFTFQEVLIALHRSSMESDLLLVEGVLRKVEIFLDQINLMTVIDQWTVCIQLMWKYKIDGLWRLQKKVGVSDILTV